MEGTMAERSTTDPAAIWRELVSQWEKGVNEIANKAMGSAEFSRVMNQATSGSLGLQQSLGDLIGKYLTALNLPSRAEMVSIGERLTAIEATLNRIAVSVDRLDPNAPAAAERVARPPRTKRAPRRTSDEAPPRSAEKP
jgi:poly(hydroxyalkanoate) synthase III subunit E